MYNLIRMNVYRLTHSLSTWVLLFFTVFMAVFSVVMTNVDIETMRSEGPEQITDGATSTEEIQLGITVASDPSWVDGVLPVEDVCAVQIQSGILALLCVIFTAIFVTAEQKNGYIKNIAGQFPGRIRLVMGKFLIVALQILVMLLVFTLTIVLAGKILWGSRFQLEDALLLIRFLGIQFLLHLGFCSLILLLGTLTGSSAAAMTVGILLTCGLGLPIYSLINRGLQSLPVPGSFDIGSCMAEVNIRLAGPNAAPDILQKSVGVGFLFTIIFLFLTIWITRKRDIR
ncbi:MAG TPA: ABC transporter permease [Candidatus Pullilachnospira intestinigallinarum]|nr:ABC transporter permease [Candidatus Pullilachnospira intestinigallinarum]